MVNTKNKNKPGRVGVKRVRLTRAELKKQCYVMGRGVERDAQKETQRNLVVQVREEKEFMRSLLKLKSANSIHDAIRQHLD